MNVKLNIVNAILADALIVIALNLLTISQMKLTFNLLTQI